MSGFKKYRTELALLLLVPGIAALFYFYNVKPVFDAAAAKAAEVKALPRNAFEPSTYASLDEVVIDTRALCFIDEKYESLSYSVHLKDPGDVEPAPKADVVFMSLNQDSPDIRGPYFSNEAAAKLIKANNAAPFGPDVTKRQCLPSGAQKLKNLAERHEWMATPGMTTMALHSPTDFDIELTREPLPVSYMGYEKTFEGKRGDRAVDELKNPLLAKFSFHHINPNIISSKRKYKRGELVEAAEVVVAHEGPYVLMLSVNYDGTKPGQEVTHVKARSVMHQTEL